MKIIPDINILDELKNGSVPALERIFNLYSVKLFYFINSYIRNKEISEELTQDVFIRLWENKHNLKTSFSINNYLYTIAKNLCIVPPRRKTHFKPSIYIKEFLKIPLDQIVKAGVTPNSTETDVPKEEQINS